MEHKNLTKHQESIFSRGKVSRDFSSRRLKNFSLGASGNSPAPRLECISSFATKQTTKSPTSRAKRSKLPSNYSHLQPSPWHWYRKNIAANAMPIKHIKILFPLGASAWQCTSASAAMKYIINMEIGSHRLRAQSEPKNVPVNIDPVKVLNNNLRALSCSSQFLCNARSFFFSFLYQQNVSIELFLSNTAGKTGSQVWFRFNEALQVNELGCCARQAVYTL